MNCPKCNAKITEGQKFCTKCGEHLPKLSFCTKCGNRLNPGSKFCTKCGAPNPNIERPIPEAALGSDTSPQRPTIAPDRVAPKLSPVVEESTQEASVASEAADPMAKAPEITAENPEVLGDNPEILADNPEVLAEDNEADFAAYLPPPKKNIMPWILGIMLVIVILGLIGWKFKDDIGIIFKTDQITQTTPEATVENVESEEAGVESITETVVDESIGANDLVYLSGKIDGKYPVHMILDLGQREGVYYYDKYGPSNVISVSITSLKALNNGNWNITLTKHTDRYDNEEKWYGVLTSENFAGTGEYLNKDLSFDMTVDNVSSNTTDPLIEKSISSRSSSADQWTRCEFSGYVTGGGKAFPIRITASKNGRWEFKDAVYYNLDYNVSIPVDIEFDNPNIYIVEQAGQSMDLHIKAWKEGNEFNGTMTSKGSSLPITFTLND